MTENKEEKLCPLQNQKPCLKEKCALYIQIKKETINPYTQLTYNGCGLITHIPWEIKPNP